MHKFNYIIFGSSWGFYTCAYSDIINLPEVSYVAKPINNIILRIIRKIHLSPFINKLINLPGKELWCKLYINKKCDNRKPLCFFIFADWFCVYPSFIKFIKHKYPDSKVVIMFNDLVHTKKNIYTNQPINISELKKESDLVLSFDFKDVEKYGVRYYPIPYSCPFLKLNDSLKEESDVYFLGQAKNRLKEIHSVFMKLRSIGLKTNFIIAGVPKEKQRKEDGITYVDNLQISYVENLKYVAKTKCILEIMQKDGSGFTSRTLESVYHGKKMLTNNKFITKAPFYNPKFISVFEDAESIDNDFLEHLKESNNVEYGYKEFLSPKNLLNFLDREL